MALPIRNLNGEVGDMLVHAHKCTLADYTSGGTTAPAVDDIVTVSSAGNWYVKRPGDGVVGKMGRVTKVDLAPSGTDEGLVEVEWFDCERIIELPIDDLSTATLGNSAITDGADSVAKNFDAGDTTGNYIVMSKSGASGAGYLYCGVFAL